MNNEDIKKKPSIGEQLDQLRGTGGQRNRILIVDDEITIQTLVHRMLRSGLAGSGIEVVTANDGLDAIIKLQGDLYGRVALVISDFQMPRMQGDELLKDIRREEMPYHLPIDEVPLVLMSANLYMVENPDTIADASLEKPFTIPELQNAVTKAIARVLERREKSKNFREGDPA